MDNKTTEEALLESPIRSDDQCSSTEETVNPQTGMTTRDTSSNETPNAEQTVSINEKLCSDRTATEDKEVAILFDITSKSNGTNHVVDNAVYSKQTCNSETIIANTTNQIIISETLCPGTVETREDTAALDSRTSTDEVTNPVFSNELCLEQIFNYKLDTVNDNETSGIHNREVYLKSMIAEDGTSVLKTDSNEQKITEVGSENFISGNKTLHKDRVRLKETATEGNIISEKEYNENDVTLASTAKGANSQENGPPGTDQIDLQENRIESNVLCGKQDIGNNNEVNSINDGITSGEQKESLGRRVADTNVDFANRSGNGGEDQLNRDRVNLYRMNKDDTDSSGSDTSEDSSTSDDETESNAEISTSESEKEAETVRVAVKHRPLGNVRTKGEVAMDDLPPLEDMKITLPEDVQLEEIGSINSIIDVLVIIQSKRGTPALDEGSLLFTVNHKLIGQIFETFGPVVTPLYCVRFNKKEDIEPLSLEVGTPIYFVPLSEGYTRYVFVDQLRRLKGSDASWEHNNEPPEKFLDYSDDEEERRVKAKQRGKNTNVENEQDEGALNRKKRMPKTKHNRQEEPGRGCGPNRNHYSGRGGARPYMPPQPCGFNQNYGQFRQRPPWVARGNLQVGSRFLWRPRLPPPHMGPGWMPDRHYAPGQRFTTNNGTSVPGFSFSDPRLPGMSEPHMIQPPPYINQSGATGPSVSSAVVDTRFMQNVPVQPPGSTGPNGPGQIYSVGERGPPQQHFIFGQPPPQP